MPSVYFCWSDADHDLIDRRAAVVTDFKEASTIADRLVHALITAPTTDDWRGWTLRATDEYGDEIFAVPFATAIGRLH